MKSIPVLEPGREFHPWLGVFETLRVDNGRPRFVEEHWLRLREACTVLGLKIRTDFRRRTRLLPRTTGRWRWVVTAEKSWDLFQSDNRPARRACRLASSPVRVGSENWDARWKTISYLCHWQARQICTADEALLCNERGEIAGGAMSNLFWVRGGHVFTPPAAAGCRNGVVRHWVIRRSPASEKRLTLADLLRADEIFLTNSWIGVQPVIAVDKRRFAAGPVTRGLREQLRQDYAAGL